MAKRKDDRPELLALMRGDQEEPRASISLSGIFAAAEEDVLLEKDGSARVGVYRLEKIIRVKRRHEFREEAARG